jgi:hypothetical protein
MTKFKLISILLTIFFIFRFAEAQSTNVTSTKIADRTSDIGVGLVVGSASGVTTEYWTSPSDSWNINVLGYGTNIGVAFGHAWYLKDAFFSSSSIWHDFTPFGGLQALGVFGQADDFLSRKDRSAVYAAQVPLGIQYVPHLRPYGIFAEMTPGYEVSPVGYFYVAGDLGARFYF